MTSYDYKELREKAIAFNATKEDRMALLEWFENYGTMYWNGESYDMDGGIRLFPIYELVDEELEQYDIVDAEIR